jgi:dinuclear metal center YbgI/SA1388 family protein
VSQLGELIAAMEEWYDPTWAESWDAVGLVCGDPRERVEQVLLAVDPVLPTVDEAVNIGAQLLITHHPLLLTPVHGVPVTSPKGALVHRMIRADLAHFVIHTNADIASPGVSDALADRLGLGDVRPLEAGPVEPMEKIVVFVPTLVTDRLVDALAAAGAGHIGDYERCAWTTEGVGTFRPGPGTHPAVGQTDVVERVAETRVEMVLPAARRAEVIRAMRSVHPYEQPAFDIFAEVPLPGSDDRGGRHGLGRIGHLPAPISLPDFVRLTARALPTTESGVRAAGNRERPVQAVAVCGGSGASLIETARAAGADVYLTADLKHHATVEAVTEHGPDAMALVDAAHWATEAPWLALLARQLGERFAATGLKVTVSEHRTDPWTVHVPSEESSPSEP